MNLNLVSDRPPLSSLLRIFLIVLLLGWIFVGQTMGILAGSLIYEGNFLVDMSDPTHHPDLRNSILLSQGVGSLIGLILLPWYYLKFSEQRDLTNFFKAEHQSPLLVLGIGIAVFGLGFALSPVVEWNANVQFPEWMSGFGQWVRKTEGMAESIIKSITGNLTPLAFVSTFLVVAILPAIGEELVFRGLIQTELMRAVRNPHVSILITSVLFSAIHFQFLGFVPRMLIGMFLGYLYFWSGNLWVPVIAHFFNNGIQLVGLYLFQKDIIHFDVERPESAPLPMVGMSLVVMLLILYYLKNYFTSRSTSSRDLA